MDTTKDGLTQEQQAALDALQQAEATLAALGFCIFRQASLYSLHAPAGPHFSTHVSSPETMSNAELNHAFADAVRDLSVEWSNARHKERLCWSE